MAASPYDKRKNTRRGQLDQVREQAQQRMMRVTNLQNRAAQMPRRGPTPQPSGATVALPPRAPSAPSAPKSSSAMEALARQRIASQRSSTPSKATDADRRWMKRLRGR